MSLMEILAWPLGWVMWFFYNFLGHSYVLSLVLFTIVIRALLIPSAIKQQKTSAKMALFQPKLQQLQKKYGKNKQKMQEEQMKLYEEEGYNPMGGCLPMLIQLPILYGLFNVVYNPITHLLRIANDSYISAAVNLIKTGTGSSSPQIWLMKILSNPSVVDTMTLKNDVTTNSILEAVNQIPANLADMIKSVDLNFFGLYLGDVPTYTSALIIIPILSGLSAFLVSLLSTKLNSRNNPNMQGGGMLKGMMLIMPLMSFFIAFSVPAGVGLYWTISNILAGVQSFVLYKIYTPERMERIVAQEKEAIRTGKKKKKQSLMSKMQSAQTGQMDKTPAKNTISAEEAARQKELNSARIAEARKRMAEKYGDYYDENEK